MIGLERDITLVEIFNPACMVPIEVKGWCRNDLPRLFKALGYTHGAEIGVWRAVFTKLFCDAGLSMIAIDAWAPYKDYLDHAHFHPPNYGEIDRAYEEASRVLSPYGCRIIRKLSVDAAREIEDRSLDFVYIDANHSLEAVVQDLTVWSDKVRSGGIISGHDYRRDPLNEHIQVVEAVHSFTEARGIFPWYVLGRSDAPVGEPVDLDRSYLWVNP